MLKRKRGQHDSGKTDPAKEVEAKIVHGKKLLNKALKLAKNFERQKMAKRIKLAQKEDPTKVERLQKEAEALKNLDITTAANTHLHKTLLKTKTIAESNLLPSYVSSDIKKPEGTEEDVLAVSNVTARLYNAKPVKVVMTQIMGFIYAAIGIKSPTTKGQSDRKVSKKDGTAEESQRTKVATHDQNDGEADSVMAEDLESEPANWEFDSGIDDQYLSRLASSSEDEEEEEDDRGEEEGHKDQRSSSKQSKTLHARDLSITPSVSDAESDSEASESPGPVTKVKRASKPERTKGGSTFLPTLMGGYLSGEESATDNEDVAPPPRKNRRGQRARREIWEKKYGAKAAHLKKEAEKAKNVVWDPKRGAVTAKDRAVRKGRNGFVRSREQVTGENAIPVASRNRGVTGPTEKEKRDAKPLHPSWIAARKAKEEKKAASFEGKKIVFD